MYVFTYYAGSVSQFFVRSIKSLSSVLQSTGDTNLVIITDETVPTKTINTITPLFGDLSIVPPKLFLPERTESKESVPNVNFLEVLLLYPDYDRLYFDPNLFLMNSILFPKENSLFFKQHTGALSTKLAYLKAGPQFSTAFSSITNRSGYKTITDQSFTYVISNNFLIKKQLFDKQIVNGRLFETSGVRDLSTSSVIAIDLSEVLKGGSNMKVWSTVERIELTQRSIVLTGIKKRKPTTSSPLKTASSVIFQRQAVDLSGTSPKRDRLILDKIFHLASTSKKKRQNIFEFSDPGKLTIIVPVYKNAHLTAECLQSIVDSSPDNFNLLVINDSPLDSDVEKLGNDFREMFETKFSKSEYVFLTNEENMGFIRTVNRGLHISEGDVILLNSDTVVSQGWIERLLAYKSFGKVASVTPLSNSASQCSFPIQEQTQSHYNDLHPNLIDKVFSRLPMENYHEAPTGVGFCMLMTREALTAIGYFDQINFKVGYGEENDWCWRAINAGFINIIAPNVYIAHEHGASFADVKNLTEIRLKNKQALVAKYPNYFSIISEYYNKRLLEPIYPWLKYALDFEYSRPVKKPVKLVLGEKELPPSISTAYSEVSLKISDLSFQLTANDFLMDKTTIFARTANSIKAMVALLDPTLIEAADQEYLEIPEIKEILTKFEGALPEQTIVVEIPHHDDSLSGGISRMERLVFELPRYLSTSGGVRESLKFLDKFPLNFSVSARFQRIIQPVPVTLKNWTVGLPDQTFPACEVCITYSDTPYLEDLTKLPQVKKVLLYMLSYGMAIERERKNVHTSNVTVMCSTKKLEKAILSEGVNVHRVGFALDMKEMYVDDKIQRKNYLAIMYHANSDKRYDLAVAVANDLYLRKKIDGVITFGGTVGYEHAQKPLGLVKHYSFANRDEIREIFNTCKCYIMPSVSEGLNLSPVESTLCGCPAVICDGAIDELFFDGRTCFLAVPESVTSLLLKTETILSNYDKYSVKFRKELKPIVDSYNWETVVKNIMNLL